MGSITNRCSRKGRIKDRTWETAEIEPQLGNASLKTLFLTIGDFLFKTLSNPAICYVLKTIFFFVIPQNLMENKDLCKVHSIKI